MNKGSISLKAVWWSLGIVCLCIISWFTGGIFALVSSMSRMSKITGINFRVSSMAVWAFGLLLILLILVFTGLLIHLSYKSTSKQEVPSNDVLNVSDIVLGGRTITVIGDTNSNRYITVNLEEHLCREVRVYVPNDYGGDLLQYGEEQAKRAYFNEDIILTADDFNGNTLMEVIFEDKCTDWFNI